MAPFAVHLSACRPRGTPRRGAMLKNQAPKCATLDTLHGYLDSWRGIGAFGASTQRGRGFTQQERDALVAWIRGSVS
jgi:hypothetical protein